MAMAAANTQRAEVAFDGLSRVPRALTQPELRLVGIAPRQVAESKVERDGQPVDDV